MSPSKADLDNHAGQLDSQNQKFHQARGDSPDVAKQHAEQVRIVNASTPTQTTSQNKKGS